VGGIYTVPPLSFPTPTLSKKRIDYGGLDDARRTHRRQHCGPPIPWSRRRTSPPPTPPPVTTATHREEPPPPVVAHARYTRAARPSPLPRRRPSPIAAPPPEPSTPPPPAQPATPAAASPGPPRAGNSIRVRIFLLDTNFSSKKY
jgi:hypothetical protein